MPSEIQEFKELYENKEFKDKSFNFLVDIIERQVNELGVDNLSADKAIEYIDKIIPDWSDIEFAFLLSHSCYIPDHYPETGSEETLFSKLVEYIVCEWGRRLGYESILQKEKSTKEDVTFFSGNSVIVCDAKSNRLGRSQKSPNVKDVMKTSEYQTWLNFYDGKTKVGGFATFPSLLEWSKGSAIHTYLTDKSNPIMLVYNEYLAFMLLKKEENRELIFDTLKNYSEFFPDKISDKSQAKSKYHNMLTNQLKKIDSHNELDIFLETAKKITTAYVKHSIQRLESIIDTNAFNAQNEVENLSKEELKEQVVKLKIDSLNKEYNRILINIIKFRT